MATMTTSRKAMALTRSSRASKPSAKTASSRSLHEQLADIPDFVIREVQASLDGLASYRQNLARGRMLDGRHGGQGRYVDDMRRHDRKLVLSCVETLREFTRFAPENDVNPIAVLKAMLHAGA